VGCCAHAKTSDVASSPKYFPPLRYAKEHRSHAALSDLVDLERRIDQDGLKLATESRQARFLATLEGRWPLIAIGARIPRRECRRSKYRRKIPERDGDLAAVERRLVHRAVQERRERTEVCADGTAPHAEGPAVPREARERILAPTVILQHERREGREGSAAEPFLDAEGLPLEFRKALKGGVGPLLAAIRVRARAGRNVDRDRGARRHVDGLALHQQALRRRGAHAGSLGAYRRALLASSSDPTRSSRFSRLATMRLR